MGGIKPYWRTDDSAPFAVLLNVVEGHCHPESPDDGYDELLERVRDMDHSDGEIHRFHAELVRALEGDRAGLHPDALITAAAYDDGSDDAFLLRLWRDLHPGEPVPGRAATADE